MRVLYLSRPTLLARHFLQGWRTAFLALGDTFDVIEGLGPEIEAQLSATTYDIIMAASNEGVHRLPVERLNEAGTVVLVNALPFNSFRASPEWQTPNANPDEVHHLARLRRKLVWTQHSPEITRALYSGYEAHGIPVLALAYGADTSGPAPVGEPLTHDLIFIARLRHRRSGNIDLIRRLLALTPRERVVVYGDAEWRWRFGIDASPTPEGLDLATLYRETAVAPNIHTQRQRQHAIQLNDRSFQIPASGGYQICDNPLIRLYFADDEVPYVPAGKEFVERVAHALRHPEERAGYVVRAHARACADHSWLNRLAALFEAAGIDRPVRVGDRVWKPYRLPPRAEGKLAFERWLRYVAEAAGVRAARNLKRSVLGSRSI